MECDFRDRVFVTRSASAALRRRVPAYKPTSVQRCICYRVRLMPRKKRDQEAKTSGCTGAVRIQNGCAVPPSVSDLWGETPAKRNRNKRKKKERDRQTDRQAELKE